jgi:hypothetical protein
MEQYKLDNIRTAIARSPNAIGPMLGRLVIEGNIPVEAVGELLDATKTTVYRWIHEETHPSKKSDTDLIKLLIQVLRKAQRAKELPLDGTKLERIAKTHALVKEYYPQILAPAKK